MPRKSTEPETYEQTSFDLFEEVQRVVETAVDEAGAEYHTSALAAEVLDNLRIEHPDVYTGWLDLIALDALKTSIGRVRNISRRRQSVFSGQRSAFDIAEEVDKSHTQRRIGDMNRSDLDYVSRNYLKRGKTMTLRGRRFAELVKRMPNTTITVRESSITEVEVAGIFLD
jgi:hypothetical protein